MCAFTFYILLLRIPVLLAFFYILVVDLSINLSSFPSRFLYIVASSATVN